MPKLKALLGMALQKIKMLSANIRWHMGGAGNGVENWTDSSLRCKLGALKSGSSNLACQKPLRYQFSYKMSLRIASARVSMLTHGPTQ